MIQIDEKIPYPVHMSGMRVLDYAFAHAHATAHKRGRGVVGEVEVFVCQDLPDMPLRLRYMLSDEGSDG